MPASQATTVTGGALVVANTLGSSAIVENGQFSVTGSFNGNGTLNGGQYGARQPDRQHHRERRPIRCKALRQATPR